MSLPNFIPSFCEIWISHGRAAGYLSAPVKLSQLFTVFSPSFEKLGFQLGFYARNKWHNPSVVFLPCGFLENVWMEFALWIACLHLDFKEIFKEKFVIGFFICPLLDISNHGCWICLFQIILFNVRSCVTYFKLFESSLLYVGWEVLSQNDSFHILLKGISH